MDKNINRVYINPNFSRLPAVTSMNASSLYVNPNFTGHNTNLEHNTNLRHKIYVNPNFIPVNGYLESNHNSETVAMSTNTRSQFNEHNNPPHFGENNNLPNNKILFPSSKSRYTLVRNVDNNVSKNPSVNKEFGTIKISKYKSIPMHNYKKRLHIVKDDFKTTATKQTIVCKTLNLQTKYLSKSSFELIKLNLGSKINFSSKLVNKISTPKIKRSIDSTIQKKLKSSNGRWKKNNIPCRLFTKYGKCIRNEYGTCDYLHDKKHVSLCRKFLKGICHDASCLLSHELSSKKMPTCYFYLKGMCTKNTCPYLHVKLSENSKICHDFLKGYCEKAEKCPNRHIRPESKRTVDKRNVNKISHLNKYSTDKGKSKSKFIASRKNNVPIGKKEETNHTYVQDKCDTDCRYFKEDNMEKEASICEIIKPMRCKLGVLPSFIQL